MNLTIDQLEMACVDSFEDCLEACNRCLVASHGIPGMLQFEQNCKKCLEVCEAGLLACKYHFEDRIQLLEACIEACNACAKECEKNQQNHCENCGQIFRECVEICEDLVMTLA